MHHHPYPVAICSLIIKYRVPQIAGSRASFHATRRPLYRFVIIISLSSILSIKKAQEFPEYEYFIVFIEEDHLRCDCVPP
jgi:hypothetical protein